VGEAMKKGRCPKCNSTNVRKQPKLSREAVSVGLRTLPLDRYVCVTCGYTEQFVADADKLRFVEEKWPLA
jgi:transposase-like protein